MVVSDGITGASWGRTQELPRAGFFFFFFCNFLESIMISQFVLYYSHDASISLSWEIVQRHRQKGASGVLGGTGKELGAADGSVKSALNTRLPWQQARDGHPRSRCLLVLFWFGFCFVLFCFSPKHGPFLK